jgi:hypothetical protein
MRKFVLLFKTVPYFRREAGCIRDIKKQRPNKNTPQFCSSLPMKQNRLQEASANSATDEPLRRRYMTYLYVVLSNPLILATDPSHDTIRCESLNVTGHNVPKVALLLFFTTDSLNHFGIGHFHNIGASTGHFTTK